MPGPVDAANPGRPASARTPGSSGAAADSGTPASPGTPPDPFPQDLARYLAASTGLPQLTAVRVVADVATYFSETIEEFVVRRHAELKRRQLKNDEIWPLVAAEVGQRRFAAPKLSERQLRRMVYH